MGIQSFRARFQSVLTGRWFWAILSILVLFTLSPATARAAGASVVISPSVRNILHGSTGTVNVIVNDYTDSNPPGPGPNGLYGAQVKLTFDPSIVTVASLTPGPLLASGGYFPASSFDNTAGTIQLVISEVATPPQTCPALPTPCSGVLYTITFNGNTTGTSPVHVAVEGPPLVYPRLGNINGMVIPVSSTTDGLINVYSPTATTIAGFSGRAVNEHQALLQWETGTELELAGFNLWQSADGANYTKLNSEIISAKSPGQLIPNTYEFSANGLNSGKTYLYKLEALDSNGIPEWVGPVTITLPVSCTGKPAAPAVIAPVSKQVVSTHVTLDWSDVPCANAYRVQLRRDTVNGPNLKQTTTVSNLTTDVSANHKYYWRVRTIVAKNHSGWSTWRSFTVRGPTSGK